MSVLSLARRGLANRSNALRMSNRTFMLCSPELQSGTPQHADDLVPQSVGGLPVRTSEHFRTPPDNCDHGCLKQVTGRTDSSVMLAPGLSCREGAILSDGKWCAAKFSSCFKNKREGDWQFAILSKNIITTHRRTRNSHSVSIVRKQVRRRELSTSKPIECTLRQIAAKNNEKDMSCAGLHLKCLRRENSRQRKYLR